MKKSIGLALVAASVALAVVIGQRMSTDAMAVVIGVVFGVAASIPTSLLIVAATRGRRQEPPPISPPEYHAAPTPQAPPPQIYIVSPSGTQQAPWLPGGMQAQLPMPPNSYYGNDSSRRFKVVGQDEHWLEAEPDSW